MRAFICDTCGQKHDGLPDIAFRRPDAWLTLSARDRKRGFESDDACIVKLRGGNRGFVRGVLEIPVRDAKGRAVTPIGFGPWAEVSLDDLSRVVLGEAGQVIEPFRGTLASDLSVIGAPIGCPVEIDPSDNTERPLFRCADARRSLARLQREGVDLQAAARLVHEALESSHDE